MGKNSKSATGKTIALNKKARHDYEILEEFEAGLVLMGSEVKSLREGQASIKESHAGFKEGEIYLMNAHINEYGPAKNFGHEPRRLRKLLLNQREINKLMGLVQKQGVTLVPLSLYFNAKGIAKCKIGVGKGKKKHDKRESEKKRDWQRQRERLLK